MFGARFWGCSALFTLIVATLIGIPTVLIPNPFFHRMTPTGPLDYLIWGLSAALLGPLLALAVLFPSPGDARASQRSGSMRALAGGILSFLSVGCPVCNQVVVLLLGAGGAMTFFNPLRPFLGAAAIVILAVTLFLRVRVLRFGCPVPVVLPSVSGVEREPQGPSA
jgi:hypothetical protein